MGEYEPNDSRNVTGAGNKMGQNQTGHEGNPNTNQGGQHWQQGGAGSQPNSPSDAPIAAGQQQGHGQDPGMRSQAVGGQQQQFQQGGGQMGGQSGGQSGAGQSGAGQSGGGSGFQGTAAGGMRQGAQGAGNGMAAKVREHMEVIGADGAHVGTVDHVEGDRIKLTKRDSGMGSHQGHHHYLPLGLIAEIEGDRVRLSANGDVAWSMIEEENRRGM